MPISGSESESNQYVCDRCIGDHIVSAAIETDGRIRECSYCGNEGHTASIEEIADWVDEVYPTMVGEAELTAYFPDDSDNPEHRQNGDTPNTLVAEMLECDYDSIADDVVAELSGRHSYAAIKDGDADIYDDSNDIYVLRIPRSKEVQRSWEEFCDSIKHSRRFFNDTAAALLEEIVAPILDPGFAGAKSAVRTLEPGSDERFIYRGRMANSVGARSEILAKLINQLGAPPRHLNAGGRMNAAGIPVFYGSFDVETCVAELRGPVGGTAVVGKFEILQPLRVLDLTLLQSAMFNISYFDPDVVRKFSFNRFLRGFHKEIKKAVIPGSETIDYLPTQFVAEYLWTKAEPRLDGLIFGSAQISNAKAKNIAIFPHASGAEGWYQELYPEDKAAKKPIGVIVAEFADVIVDPVVEGGLKLEEVPADTGPGAALRLVADGTVIADVKSIEYKLRTRSVAIYEMDMEYSGYDPEEYEEEFEEEGNED